MFIWEALLYSCFEHYSPAIWKIPVIFIIEVIRNICLIPDVKVVVVKTRDCEH